MMLAPTESIALGLFHDFDPDRLYVILTAYFDESGTHEGSPITLMAGWVSNEGRWRQFDKKWGQILEKNDLSHIHTKDLFQGTGEFRNPKWTDYRRDRLIRKTARLAQRQALFGLTAFLRNDDYEQVYANVLSRKPRKFQIDTKYGLCFRACLSYIFQTLETMGAEPGFELHLILEHGHKNAGDAKRIFDDVFCRYAPPEQVEAVKTFAFRKKKETYGLQAADMLAYGTLRTERHGKTEVSPTPVHDARFPKPKKGGDIHRVPMSIANLTELRDNLLSADDHRSQFGRRRHSEIKNRRKDSSEE